MLLVRQGAGGFSGLLSIPSPGAAGAGAGPGLRAGFVCCCIRHSVGAVNQRAGTATAAAAGRSCRGFSRWGWETAWEDIWAGTEAWVSRNCSGFCGKAAVPSVVLLFRNLLTFLPSPNLYTGMFN